MAPTMRVARYDGCADGDGAAAAMVCPKGARVVPEPASAAARRAPVCFGDEKAGERVLRAWPSNGRGLCRGGACLAVGEDARVVPLQDVVHLRGRRERWA